MEDIEKLKLAKATYSAGTKYRCADGSRSEFTVENPEEFTIAKPGVIYGESGKGCIFYKGRWAEIIEPAHPSYRVKFDDRIVFKVRDQSFEYRVFATHLSNVEESNHAIFDALGMGNDEKMRFCDKAYGYEAESGSFPECQAQDYEALTNVVKALYDKCNKINVYYEV
jgi:hypothetical protein